VPVAAATKPAKRSPGLFHRLIGMLFGDTEPAPAATQQPASSDEAQRDRNGEQRRRSRGGRNRNRGRGGEGRSDQREAREPREQREPREAKEAREPREPRENRERSERRRERPQPIIADDSVADAIVVETGESGENRPQRRPRDRRPRGPAERVREALPEENSIEIEKFDDSVAAIGVTNDAVEESATDSEPDSSARPDGQTRSRRRRRRGGRDRGPRNAETTDGEADSGGEELEAVTDGVDNDEAVAAAEPADQSPAMAESVVTATGIESAAAAIGGTESTAGADIAQTAISSAAAPTVAPSVEELAPVGEERTLIEAEPVPTAIEPAPTAVVVQTPTASVVATPSQPAAPASSGRATNDPRVQPRHVEVVGLQTIQLQLVPLNAAPAQPDNNRPQPQRAANDPRLKRNV
jgi:ribonuclease E